MKEEIEEEQGTDATPTGKRKRKSAKRRWRIKIALERERLAKKEEKRLSYEARKMAGTLWKSVFRRLTFPEGKEEEEKVSSENRSKKRGNSAISVENRKENKLKPSAKGQKERKQTKISEKLMEKKKKRDKEGQKSVQGDSPVVNDGDSGGGMNVGAAGFGGGQGQFGNGNPMMFFPFQWNRQSNEQSVSEVMQAMQVGFGLGVAAMAQMRTGQESQMTANHGTAGFSDGYGGGEQGGGQGGQGGPQCNWRR